MDLPDEMEDVEMEVPIPLDMEDDSPPAPFSPPEPNTNRSVPSPSSLVQMDGNTTPPVPITLYGGMIKADSLEGLDTSLVVKAWLEEAEGGEDLWNMLTEYWRKVVPHIYTLDEGSDCLTPFSGSGPLADKYLIEPLASFLGGEGNKLSEFLQKTDQRPTVCGKVFQVGEATYSCRQCGMDPTCVLCADCFKRSDHKHHKYKIATSSGGGYCDCGDPEAWKDFVHCESHKPKEPDRDGVRVGSPEQLDFEKRVLLLLPNLFAYVFDLSSNTLERRLPNAIGGELFRVDRQSQSGQSSSETSEILEKEKPRCDLFCTVLYNDETHTFDLVIQTLTRALQCEKKHAVEFATTIDREGRSIVKVANFNSCHEIQKIIERSTSGRSSNPQPLYCVVMKREVLQHQTFALKVLSWLESLCSDSYTIRMIVQDILYGKLDNPHVKNAYSQGSGWMIEGVLLRDTKLWKAARSCWHRLIIAALLKEYDSKKAFAEVFTKQYANIMDDFIRDDHDHAYSVSSLSVQIFTVPSIAHYLVEEKEVIYTILRVVLSYCEQRVNIAGKLEFDKNSVVAVPGFKRMNFAILDLKYLLTNPPNEWSQKMVKSYTQGIDSFLKLLSLMQEMDPVIRQVGHHMEYEPEWESAFNLHIKLQPVFHLSLEWCGLNKPVFIRAFRHCLCDLTKAYEGLKQKTETVELANHSATCYVYDVASQPVSVHLPLTRYFAGLCLHLQNFDLDFLTSSEFNFLQTEKPVPEMIIEPALRTQVLCAQVNASMWKRNGYALLNQLYFYHNVRCRADMLDKDIITLQIGASIIESNEFLLHVINKFKLTEWIRMGFCEKHLKSEGQEEDASKFYGVLIEEFLGLMITLVSARFVPGVGQVSKADCIKKEVIQQLCIAPMTHSMLNKSLVEDVNLETGLELVIRDVANQKSSPGGRTPVLYELKPEFFADYDVYHYHYTREEMSKAEERQRSRRKANKEPEIFPPPRLPPFAAKFDMLINFLQCDVFFHVISLVLKKSLQKYFKIFGESVIRKALHLLGHGLNEELLRNQKESDHFFQFSHNAGKWKIWEILDKMLQESYLSQHHDMIRWLKQQYNAIKPEVHENSQHQEDMTGQSSEEEETRRRKAELMKEAKEKMMAKMAAAQKKFMMVNQDLFEEAQEETPMELGFPEAESATQAEIPKDIVCVGPNKANISNSSDEKYICMLCKEEQSVGTLSRRFVLACFLQRSTMMSQYREKLSDEEAFWRSWEGSNNTELHLQYQNHMILNPSLNMNTVMTTCGHVMHDHCWSCHMDAVIGKERRRPYRLRHPISFDVDKLEWLCPMCGVLCNAALPMIEPIHKLIESTEQQDTAPEEENQTDPSKIEADDVTEADENSSFKTWLDGVDVIMRNRVMDKSKKLVASRSYEDWLMDSFNEQPDLNLLYYWQPVEFQKVMEELEREAGNQSKSKQFKQLYPRYSKHPRINEWFGAGFGASFANFMTRNYHIALNLEIIPQENDLRLMPLIWKCLAFTIISSEAFHRNQNMHFFGENVPLRRSIGIKHLVRACIATALERQGFWLDYAKTFVYRLLFPTFGHAHSIDVPSLFESDAFGLLVSLTLAMPSVFAVGTDSTGGRQARPGGHVDHYILRLMYIYHLTQILVANDFSDCAKERQDMDVDASSQSASRKEQFIVEVWKKMGKNAIPDDLALVDADKAWNAVKEAATPFLRCCAKFYECLTCIAPPPELEYLVETPFDALVKYLDLPRDFEDLSQVDLDIINKWISVEQYVNYAVPRSVKDKPTSPSSALAQGSSPGNKTNESSCVEYLPESIPMKYPRNLPQLVTLPDDYSELINMVSDFSCTNSKTLDSRTPTMCLFCGAILCSQSYCCQKELKPQITVGSCIYHANFCGGGTGMFLRIRECKVFLTNGHNRGCYVETPNIPYLDEYGEPDPGLRRGNPLKLCKATFDNLRNIWIQHSIPEHVARRTEQNSLVGTTEWQHF